MIDPEFDSKHTFRFVFIFSLSRIGFESKSCMHPNRLQIATHTNSQHKMKHADSLCLEIRITKENHWAKPYQILNKKKWEQFQWIYSVNTVLFACIFKSYMPNVVLNGFVNALYIRRPAMCVLFLVLKFDIHSFTSHIFIFVYIMVDLSINDVWW